MRTSHRIVSAMGLWLLLGGLLISLGHAPRAAAEPEAVAASVDVAAATSNAGWSEMGAGSASGSGVSQTGLAGAPSLAIGPDGVPVIGWRDGSGPPSRISNDADDASEIYVKRWSGSKWVEMGAGSASGGGISQNNGVSGDPSLAIGPDGVPVVAWQDNSGGNREIYARRYAGEQSPPLAFRSFIPAAFYKP